MARGGAETNVEAERFSIAALLRVLKPPLCKGRWHGEAVTEGL
jgi:hypothetical protein